MKQVYVALGSNLGVSKTHLGNALKALQAIALTGSWQLSRWYRSEAIGGPADQPDYTNAVCTFQTDLSPEELLETLQGIEALEGRERLVHWGPRTLDLDIIWIEDVELSTDKLTIPHPRAHQRAFVLKPLLDLNATFQLENEALSIHLTRVADQIIHLIDL